MRYAANAVTVGRMALSLLLLTAEPLSGCFYGLYAAAGASDVLDGAIARRTGTASRLGAVLDSAADLVFFCAVCCRLLPLLLRALPLAVWAATLLTAALRCAAWGTAFLRFRRFAPLHTWLNKAVGAGLFCLPWFWEWLTPYCGVLAALAVASAAEELYITCRVSALRPDDPGVLFRRCVLKWEETE